MKRLTFQGFMSIVLIVLAVSVLAIHQADSAEKQIRCAWSRYTGWEPLGYMQSSGIMAKWNKKYGTSVQWEYVNDYIESINLYTSGTFDCLAVTNMDALTNPAIGGVDTQFLVIGDYSDGNDGVVLVNGSTVQDLRGRKIRLVMLSVSHYLLARGLEINGMSEKDVAVEFDAQLSEKDQRELLRKAKAANAIVLVNTSDADIENVFRNDADPKKAVVTWNPMLMGVRNVAGTTMVFDSSKIPGEILDALVGRTALPENAKKAIVGAWYETLSVMSANDKKAQEAIRQMAKQTGGTLAQFQTQLKTTHMYYKPADAVAFVRSEKLKETMQYVRQFSFTHGLFPGARNVDVVGIQFPDGSVLGSSTNVKMRFTDTYMALAAEGNL